MSRKLFDFSCICGHRQEDLVDLDVDGPPTCNKCGLTMTKVQSPIRFTLEGISGHFPTASDQWVKKRKEKQDLERRERERHEPS